MSNRSEVSEVLIDLARRAIATAIAMISPVAGIAVSAGLFATWMLRKKRGKVDPIDREIEIVIELRRAIDERKRRLEELKKAIEKADEVDRPILEQSITLLERELSDLIEEYQLHQLRILAYRKLRALGDEKLIKEFEKALKKLEKGEEPTDQELAVLRHLEEMWRRRELEYVTISRMLSQ